MRRVAITAFGVVSPIGVGREDFFSALREGRSGIDRISRFEADTFDARLAGEVKEKLKLPATVEEVATDDPKVGFVFEACTQALAKANIEHLNQDAILHLGTSLEIFNFERIVRNGKPDFIALMDGTISKKERPFQIPLDTAGRLVISSFGTPGRFMTNCSACAASTQAIGHGFRNVRHGRCEVAVCGGFDSMINPLGVGGFQLLGALTTDNDRGSTACRPFDASRSGTVLGEGAAVVVIEPLEKAKAEGKRILAEVVGYASTLDAYGLSAPDPTGDGFIRVMQDALADAGLDPNQIHHINTHGTGTRLNDEVEANAIRRVFKGVWENIPVAATKSMTGHLIAAAGAVEVGACLFTLLEGLLPPNPSLQKVGAGCELHHVTGHAAPFDGEYVLTNSFGFGGQNASLVLRRYDGKGG